MDSQKFTAEDIVELNPCWLEESDGEQRIRDLVASYGGGVDVIDVLLCNEVSDMDAIWLANRLATVEQSRLAAALFAEIILDAEVDAGRTPDPRSKAAVVVARRHAVGQATDEELKTARAAAWAAYRDAAAGAVADARTTWAATAADAAAAAAEAVANAAGAGVDAWAAAAAAAAESAAAGTEAIAADTDTAADAADVAYIASWKTSRELFLQILLHEDKYD
jgi:hypothetical protein